MPGIPAPATTKAAIRPRPPTPNNPARQACRVALITDSASGAQTEQILYDGEKRPARINFFSGGSDNDLFGYYTYAYDGNGLSVTGHRPDGTVDTTVGTIRARVLDGLITQYTRSVTLGGTMVLDSSTVTYDSLGIPMRLTQIHRVKPQGDTLTRTVQQLDFITADGLVMHIEQSYVNQPYPADSSRYRIESYDLVFGATPIVCNTPFLALQVLPGYLFYLGNKLPVSYSYRARNRLWAYQYCAHDADSGREFGWVSDLHPAGGATTATARGMTIRSCIRIAANRCRMRFRAYADGSGAQPRRACPAKVRGRSPRTFAFRRQ